MIRPATVEDADAIARVHIESWKAAYSGIIPDSFLSKLSLHDRREAWLKILRKSCRGVFVFQCETKTVSGWVSCGPSRDPDGILNGEINAVYILPGYWNRGVGSDLMDAAESYLILSGYSAFTLWVLENNARAIKFYRARGYERDGAEKGHIFDGIELMEHRYRKTVQYHPKSSQS